MQPVELARAVEERGFDGLFFPEHTHIPASRKTPFPGGGELPKHYSHTHDPFFALGACAAATSRIRLGTAICLVIEHDPITLAKEIATLDQPCPTGLPTAERPRQPPTRRPRIPHFPFPRHYPHTSRNTPVIRPILLKKDIRAELDEDLLKHFVGTVSLPFKGGLNATVAIKIVDDRGIESLKVMKLDVLV